MEELLRDWDTRFRDTYGALHWRIKDLLEAFLRCRDLHFGFVRVRCVNPECSRKEEKIVPLSCRTRGLCDSCGERRAIEWAERMVEFVLPFVPYRQLVFTIPVALRRAFLFDRSLYGEPRRVAYTATRDYMRERASFLARQSRAVPAMVVSPQSFGDLIVAHAHAHAVVLLDLFRRDGRFFAMEDIDFSALEDLFRERFFEMMLQREKILPETVERFKSCEHSGFNVSFDRKLEPDDRAGLEGLLCYIGRPPVSLRRLTCRADGMLHYQGKRLHPRLGIDHQLLTPVEFLAMLIPHIALEYEITLRSYGAISTTFRRRAGWIQQPPVDASPPLAVVSAPSPGAAIPPAPPTVSPPSPPEVPEESDFIRRRKRWTRPRRERPRARLIAKTLKDDPGICGGCGHRMRIIAAIGPEQPDVIERVLRHVNRWDPPWKRQRRARGPPPGAGRGAQSRAQGAPPGPTDTIDPVIHDELYALDSIPLGDA